MQIIKRDNNHIVFFQDIFQRKLNEGDPIWTNRVDEVLWYCGEGGRMLFNYFH